MAIDQQFKDENPALQPYPQQRILAEQLIPAGSFVLSAVQQFHPPAQKNGETLSDQDREQLEKKPESGICGLPAGGLPNFPESRKQLADLFDEFAIPAETFETYKQEQKANRDSGQRPKKRCCRYSLCRDS